MHALKKHWRFWLYPLAAAWPVWLFLISNAFTMGYTTSLMAKLAISAVAVDLPAILLLMKTWDSLAAAGLLILLTWPPIMLLWIYG
jgi:hypothetical protein